MPTIKIPKQQALDILDSGEFISDELYDNRRWSIQHKLVFKLDGKLYIAYYSVGATEYQDEGPWDYDTEVECFEAREITKIDYEEI